VRAGSPNRRKPAYMTQRLALLSRLPPLRAALETGELSVNSARELDRHSCRSRSRYALISGSGACWPVRAELSSSPSS
jgi:hypothetical protein